MSEPSINRAFPDKAILAWMNDFAPYGIVTTDKEFRVQTWNHWMALHTGKSAQKVLNSILFDLFPDLKERRLVPRFERALQGESSILSTALHGYLFQMDSPIKESNFREMQQTARISPLLFENRVVGTIIVVEDVTQREIQSQILRQQHERDTILSWALAHLLESQQPRRGIRELFLKIAEHLDWEAYLLYLFTPDKQQLKLKAAGGITPENEKALALLPVDDPRAGELLAAARCEGTTAQSADGFERLGFRTSAVLSLQSIEGQIGVLCFGARSRDSLREGELELLSTIGKYLSVAIHKEATHLELQAAQAKLNRHAEDLERQVAERTAELSEIIADLKRFSYSLAHDLRAPIRALIGYSVVLEEDFSNALPEEASRIVGSLHRACKQLDDLTRDLLEFSKVSRADLILEKVDLETLVADAISLIPSVQGNVRIHRPLQPVLANGALLQQTILNLLDNAIKFTKDGQAPKITIWTEAASSHSNRLPHRSAPFSAVRDVPLSSPANTPMVERTAPCPARVRIVMQDEGIGIAPELHHKIFGIFERGTSSARYDGSGIGLAIVARAVERMGGSCGVESVPDVGSKFWLELPSAP